MKTKQYKYPFSNLSPIQLTDIIALQIGIHRPWISPLNEKIIIPIEINNQEYSLTDRDILEFSYLYAREVTIIIKEIKNPYLIIDIAYKTAD